MTAFAIAMMSREVTVNPAKARRALGYAPGIDVAAGNGGAGVTRRRFASPVASRVTTDYGFHPRVRRTGPVARWDTGTAWR